MSSGCFWPIVPHSEIGGDLLAGCTIENLAVKIHEVKSFIVPTGPLPILRILWFFSATTTNPRTRTA